ncbi:MAG: hypothetical protein AAFP68_14285 [Pseudomonadota bacterium]
MPWQENWTWDNTDQFVLDYLTGGEIGAVGDWQASGEYTFEFHGGHTTGYPIYIRPTGNTDHSNIPKVDTKNVYAGTYNTITDIANDGTLTAALSNNAQADLIAIIQNEWATLKTLAERFWTDSPVNVARPSAQDLWAEEEASDTGQHNTLISKDLLYKIYGAKKKT